jgi:ATP-dependent Clp protease ATP-binding subunit ClpC
MPKINVYLPDELAEAVRQTGVPVSAVCQRALEQAVRRVTAIRETILGELTPDGVAERFPQFTARAHTVLTLAIEQARTAAAPTVGTGHLLAAMIAEGGNLALHVLRAIEVQPAQAARDLARHPAAEPTAEPAATGAFSAPAAAAMQTAVTEAATLGHNYVGCEHLLLGLVGEPDGAAGQVLRALGADARLTRRAVAAALAGYVHLRAQSPAADPAQALAAALQQHLAPLAERLERLEQRVTGGER